MEMRVFAREGERRMFLEIKDISKKMKENDDCKIVVKQRTAAQAIACKCDFPF